MNRQTVLLTLLFLGGLVAWAASINNFNQIAKQHEVVKFNHDRIMENHEIILENDKKIVEKLKEMPAVVTAGFYKAEVVKIHDADTFTVNIDLGFGVSLRDQIVRAADYDAWEINKVRRTIAVTDEEVVKGKKAKADIEQIFAAAKIIEVQPGKSLRDAYGRLLLTVVIDGKPLKDSLEELGDVRHEVLP